MENNDLLNYIGLGKISKKNGNNDDKKNDKKKDDNKNDNKKKRNVNDEYIELDKKNLSEDQIKDIDELNNIIYDTFKDVDIEEEINYNKDLDNINIDIETNTENVVAENVVNIFDLSDDESDDIDYDMSDDGEDLNDNKDIDE